MGTLLSWTQGLSTPLQILLIIILVLVFKEQIWAYLSNQFGLDRNNEDQNDNDDGEAVPERASKEWFNDIVKVMSQRDEHQAQQIATLLDLMQGLKAHYNDDTTRVLEEIRDELKDGFKDIRLKHAEWDRYGINTLGCPERRVQ